MANTLHWLLAPFVLWDWKLDCVSNIGLREHYISLVLQIINKNNYINYNGENSFICTFLMLKLNPDQIYTLILTFSSLNIVFSPDLSSFFFTVRPTFLAMLFSWGRNFFRFVKDFFSGLVSFFWGLIMIWNSLKMPNFILFIDFH